MNDTAYEAQYQRWCRCATADPELAAELQGMAADPAQREDAFYRDLAFGTGGLRGVLGAGTNRMNHCTVAKASQGLADYVKANFPPEKRHIAVSYDSRVKSDLFAQTACGVFAANGIRASIYPELMPTPCLSYAVRALGCAAGVMVTASHNPAKYNGYKVYGADGCQITTEAAKAILREIEKLDPFDDVAQLDFEAGVAQGLIAYIPAQVAEDFTQAVLSQSVLYGDAVQRDVSIVYTPLNGTGLKPVLRALDAAGYTQITVVKEQEQPDGHFPTCPYPNPEIEGAMALGMEYAARQNADLLLATDPDCDRVGIAVKEENGAYRLLSGNETGMLLLDYICAQRVKHGQMPKDPVAVKTIVTIDMAERIAAHYGVRTINVLTGFKFIGEQIGLMEQQGRAEDYVFGFEESYGYLSGSYVRDKDGVDAAFLICEMFAYYKTRGVSLTGRLEALYQEYGYCLNTLHSFTFEGSAGFAAMQALMEKLRAGMEHLGPKRVLECLDYAAGLDGLPKSNVLKFRLEGDCAVVVRPSGTEPKLKAYLSVSAKDQAAAAQIEQRLAEALKALIGG